MPMVRETLTRIFAVLVIVGTVACHVPSNCGLSLNAFQRITLGMSKVEVDAIAQSGGTPAGTSRRNFEHYKYYGSDDSSHWALISFKSGSVFSKTQYGLKSDQGIATSVNLSLEDFEQISQGMSKRDVDRITHTSGVVSYSNVFSGVDVESYKYFSRNDTAFYILISTNNDRVFSKIEHALQSKHSISHQASLSTNSLNLLMVGMSKSEVEGIAHTSGILIETLVSYEPAASMEWREYCMDNDTSRRVTLTFSGDTRFVKRQPHQYK
jgi:hypothetical protein